MKMFVTRLGWGAKAVVTGDVTQIDLPSGKTSGSWRWSKSWPDGRDPVRLLLRNRRGAAPLVSEIIKAYNHLSRRKTNGREE